MKNMKKIYVAFIICIALSLAIISGCKKDLPYPIDEVKRGVLIDIVRAANTDPTLSNGVTSGNYKVRLVIPENQGDYSSLKNAQLVAVLQKTNKSWVSAVVVDNITEFPVEIPIDIADVYSTLGLTAPTVGEILYFTTNAVLNDGSTIPGWTEIAGWNNIAFSGWQIDGRNYSYNVRYSVVCPLNLDDFVGTCTVTLDEWWENTPYQVTVTKASDTQLSIAGMFDDNASNPLVIDVNLAEYTISIAKQVLEPNSGAAWWGPAYSPAYDDFSLAGSGTIDACDLKISFSATATVNAGGFGAVSFELGK